MFPFVETFGIKFYLTGVGIVIAFLVFLITGYFSSKKYNQNFDKFFVWLPLPIFLMYSLGLYFSFIFGAGKIFPDSIKSFIDIFNPYGYHFNLIGILLGFFISLWIFIKKVKRRESKKIWFDIFFHSFINAVITLGIFLLLGENFMGKSYEGWIAIKAIHPESSMGKYNGVYPLGLFLSLGALFINIIVIILKIIKKKIGLGILGFGLFSGLLMTLIPFWNTPRRGVMSFFGLFSLDIYYYFLFICLVIFLIQYRKSQKTF